MKPFDDLRSRRRGAVPDGAPRGDEAGGGARVGMVFSREARWGGSAAAVAGVGASVALAAGWGESDHDYLLIHALAALPYMVVGTGLSHRAAREGPAEYRGFWARWEAALAVGALASMAAVGSGAWHVEALAVLDVILLVATVPIWVSATVLMARAQAGRRDVSVDVLDALTAVIVLGAPGVLLVAEPLGDSDRSPSPCRSLCASCWPRLPSTCRWSTSPAFRPASAPPRRSARCWPAAWRST